MIWIALTSLAVSAATLGWSRVDVSRARKSAEKSDERADSAVEAQKAAVDAQRDIVSAILSLPGRSTDENAALARFLPDRAPEWQLLPASGSEYRLVNVGDTAYDVVVSGESFARIDPPTPRSKWLKNESATFFAVGSFGLPMGIVRVSYRRTPVAEIETWQSEVPR